MKCFLTYPNDECHGPLNNCEEECMVFKLKRELGTELRIPEEALDLPYGVIDEWLRLNPSISFLKKIV